MLIDVFVPHGRIERCPAEPILKVDTIDPRTGHRIHGWNSCTIEAQRQIETRRHIFEVAHSDGSTARREFTTYRRYVHASELEALFAEAGLSVESVTTGYRGQHPDAQSEQLLYALRRG